MSMLRRIALVGGSGVIGAVALAAVQIRTGSLFGVGSELDAFFVGAALPSVLLAVGAGSIVALVVPRLPADDLLGAARSSGRLAVLAGLYALPLTALIVALSPAIVDVLGPGLDAATSDRAAGVLRVDALSVPFTAAAFVLSAHGHAVGRGWAGGASTGVYGLVWLTLLFLEPFEESPRTVALAGLIATAFQLGSAWLLCSPRGRRPRPRLGSPLVARAALAALAAIVGATIVGRLGLLLDPIYGSFLEAGSVSELSYATRIALLAVFVSGQGAALSVLSVSRERGRRADADTAFGLVAPLLLALGVAAIMLIAGPAGAELLLAHGEFSAASADRIGHLLQLWAPAVVVISLIWAIESMLYAQHKTRAVLIRVAIGFAVNVVASGGFVLAVGIWGRPLGVLVGMTVQLALLLALVSDDPRVLVLRSTATLRRAATVLPLAGLAAALGFGAGAVVGSDPLSAVLATLAGGTVTVALLVRFERSPERIASPA